MAVFAVVPVKDLRSSKRRLSSVFTPRERRGFAIAMLEDVLIAVSASSVDKKVVTGEDPEVQQMAQRYGAAYLPAEGAALNPAITEAIKWCQKQGAASVLVLPADVPLLGAEDVNRILQLGGGCGSAVVLSPSRNWGTNAFYQNPAGLISPCFGAKSFLSHIRDAYRRGLSVRLHYSMDLALDIDSVEDIKKLLQVKNPTAAIRMLKKIMRENKKARALLSAGNA